MLSPTEASRLTQGFWSALDETLGMAPAAMAITPQRLLGEDREWSGPKEECLVMGLLAAIMGHEASYLVSWFRNPIVPMELTSSRVSNLRLTQADDGAYLLAIAMD